MKKILVLAGAVMAVACTEKKTETAATSKASATAGTTAAPTESASYEAKDSIATASTTNNAGSTLQQSYNITKGTAVFEVNGQTIEAKKDSVPSGMQYSNEHFIYKQHKGDISIYKDGKLFWDNIR